MEKNTIKYTEEGLQKLIDELDYLKGEKTEEIKKSLAFARSLGDFSENSELDAAKDEQGQVAARIAELEELIKNANLITDTDIKEDEINLGSYVKLYDVQDDDEIEYSIVGTNEADPANGKISDMSPIGAALIGKKIGDIVIVSTPSGDREIKVIEVSRTKDGK